MTAEILLIRHSQTDWNVQRLHQGHTDVPLNATGHRMVRLLCDALRDTSLDAVYSSDLRRARQTAEPIAKMHGVALRTDSRLREARIKTPHPTSDYPVLAFETERETEEDVVRRMSRCMRNIATGHMGRRVAVVSHGGAMRRFLAHVLGELPRPPKHQTTNVNIHYLGYDHVGWHARRLHVCDHLSGTGMEQKIGSRW